MRWCSQYPSAFFNNSTYLLCNMNTRAIYYTSSITNIIFFLGSSSMSRSSIYYFLNLNRITERLYQRRIFFVYACINYLLHHHRRATCTCLHLVRMFTSSCSVLRYGYDYHWVFGSLLGFLQDSSAIQQSSPPPHHHQEDRCSSNIIIPAHLFFFLGSKYLYMHACMNVLCTIWMWFFFTIFFIYPHPWLQVGILVVFFLSFCLFYSYMFIIMLPQRYRPSDRQSSSSLSSLQ